MRQPRRILAHATVAIILTLVAIALVWAGPDRGDLPDSIGATPDWFEADPVHALVTAVGIAAWGCVLWLVAGLVFAALAGLPGGAGRLAASLARRMLPRVLHRTLQISLGVTLMAGTAAPALAATPADMGRPATTTGEAATGDRADLAWPDSDRPSAPPVFRPVAAAPAPQLAPPEPPEAQEAAVTPVRAEAVPPGDAAGPATAWPDSDRPGTPAPSPTTSSTAWPDSDRPSSRSTPAPGPTAPASPRPDAGRPHTTAEVPAPDPGAATHPPQSAPSEPAPSEPAPSEPAPSEPAAPPEVRVVPVVPVVPVGGETAPRPTPAGTPSTAPTPSPAGTPSPATPSPAGTPQPEPTGWPDSDRPHARAGDAVLTPGPAGMGDPAADAAAGSEVVVLRGDTLWSIVARHLGQSATEADIAAEWPRWWAANRDVIGPDPDVILPGQRLLPPPGP